MTVRYVDGTDGNDSNDGLAATTGGGHGPKRTLNGVEDTPVVAGDLVHIRPGVYREMLTVDVSGTAGNEIEYRGDYAGLIWSGGGVIRVTGSDNDQTATRSSAISASTKNYRKFVGFLLDSCTGWTVSLASATYFTFSKCVIAVNVAGASAGFQSSGTQSNLIVENCAIWLFGHGNSGFWFTTSASNVGHIISNCIIFGATATYPIRIGAVGGITIRNCDIHGGYRGIIVESALPGGQTTVVNNCTIVGSTTGLYATAVGEITEDYNNIAACNAARTNTSAGANSNTYLPLFDARSLFQLMYATSNRLASIFDLAPYSQLINVAGTSPTSTDLRGQSVIGAQREWGALEYDPNLGITGGGGGAPSISPARGGGIG